MFKKAGSFKKFKMKNLIKIDNDIVKIIKKEKKKEEKLFIFFL